jgi:hypothetical protein
MYLQALMEQETGIFYKLERTEELYINSYKVNLLNNLPGDLIYWSLGYCIAKCILLSITMPYTLSILFIRKLK